jgi:hypothetical protein
MKGVLISTGSFHDSDLQQHTYVSVTSLMQSKARSLTGDADNHVPTSASVLFQGAPIFSVSVPGMYPNNQLIQKNLNSSDLSNYPT